jgi:MFS family permease
MKTERSSAPSALHPSAAAATDEAPSRWPMLAVLSLAVLLAFGLWFSATAATAQLSALWGLSASAAGWLTTTVQLGFVAGTALAAVLNLADVLPLRRYFAVCAILAALANATLAAAPSYPAALASRFFTGFFLAGVYPPAMKMVATWFLHARGLAIGTLVGALTVGKAGPYLLNAIEGAGHGVVALAASGGAVLGAALVAMLYHDGPFPFERRPFSWGLVGTVVRDRPTRLAIGGYLGHMWELYAGWVALGAFFLFYFERRGLAAGELAAAASLVAFAAIAIGGPGSVLAGAWADRWGRENVAAGAMCVSGLCALTLGWLADAPAALVVSVALLWGFAIVADSAQFSAVVTDVAPKHAVGTALTVQTSLGFALTAASIWLTVELASRFGWGPALSQLAMGPALGVLAMLRLKTVRSSSAHSRSAVAS